MGLSNSMQVALATSVVGATLALYVWSFSLEGEESVAASIGEAAPASPPQLPSARPRSSIDTSPAESAIAEFRERRLTLGPRTQPAHHIATSGKRIARIAENKLIVIEPAGSGKALEFPLRGASFVTSVQGGFLAVGHEQSLVLRHHEQTPTSYAKPTLFPGSHILPDLIEPGRLWVHHPESLRLYGYTLATDSAPLLPIAQTVELAGPASRIFLPLRDGSFTYFTGQSWQRIFTQGKSFDLGSSKHSGTPFRALRAERIDQFFILYDDAQLERVQMQGRLRVVSHTDLGDLPIDLTTTKNLVVLLRARRREPQGLSWRIELLRDSKPVAEIDLEASPAESFRGDWVSQQLEPRGLTASDSWIVLGGSRRVRAWDTKSRSLVFDSREGGHSTGVRGAVPP